MLLQGGGACVKVTQSCLTLCNPIDCTVHGILQARTLEWVAIPFSRGSSQPSDQTQVSFIAGGFFTSLATKEAQEYWSGCPIPSTGDLPNSGIEQGSPASQASSLLAELPGWGGGIKLKQGHYFQDKSWISSLRTSNSATPLPSWSARLSPETFWTSEPIPCERKRMRCFSRKLMSHITSPAPTHQLTNTCNSIKNCHSCSQGFHSQNAIVQIQ